MAFIIHFDNLIPIVEYLIQWNSVFQSAADMHKFYCCPQNGMIAYRLCILRVNGNIISRKVCRLSRVVKNCKRRSIDSKCRQLPLRDSPEWNQFFFIFQFFGDTSTQMKWFRFFFNRKTGIKNRIYLPIHKSLMSFQSLCSLLLNKSRTIRRHSAILKNWWKIKFALNNHVLTFEDLIFRSTFGLPYHTILNILYFSYTDAFP